MKYDFTNTLLYNDKGVYYTINSYNGDRIAIEQIKKPPKDSDYKFINLDDIRDNRLSIIYERTKK